jgi:hypothetical protein
MFIMFDKSKSMVDNDSDPERWNKATGALKAFFADPESAELGVALGFFPEGQCAEAADTQGIPEDPNLRNVDACATPIVDLGSLSADAAPADEQEAALIAAIDERTPNNGTPMHPALEGALKWATDKVTADPSQRTVVVLVTDGAPFGCQPHPGTENVNEDVAVLVDMAAKAYAEHGIFTYVIGLQGSFEWIVNDIAAAGGTGQAVLVNDSSTHDALLAALQGIKEQHVECEIEVPASGPGGDPIDPGKVNVAYTAGGMGEPTALGQVADAGACGESGGWYYDNPSAPSKILICGATCDSIQGDNGAKLDIVLGCETTIAN